MDCLKFQQLIAVLGELNEDQRQAVAAIVSGHGELAEVTSVIEARFATEVSCPHCQSTDVGSWGRACGLKRYRCRECRKSFNALTGTPLARLQKRGAWKTYAQAVAESVSVRKAAQRTGVSVPTAFRWRHRFLTLAKDTKAKTVSGIVEADETFFLRSFKGARKMSRAPRKRGGPASKRGASDEQVPVLVLRDRSGATADDVLESLKVAEIYRVLTPVVAKDTVLVSDGAPAYASFAFEAGIGHVGLRGRRGERRRGVFHIQNVNAYHSRLKTWMRRFNGVATKYLPSYLGWRRMFEREGDGITAQRCLLAALA
ncbi:MAG: IS1595 family transposase [Rhodomicrobium sp.]